MAAHVTQFLADYCLGQLEPEGTAEVEAHLASCEQCTDELKLLEDAVAALETMPLPPGRLWGAVERMVRGPQRFAHFVEQLVELFDKPAAEIDALLSDIDNPDLWVPGPADGVRLFPVNVGPRREGAMAAIVELMPGATFPFHPHVAEERTLIMAGGYRDSHGEEFWRGEWDIQRVSDEHSFTALQGVPCVAAVVLMPEIEAP
jgi:putative transcriptional regulator